MDESGRKQRLARRTEERVTGATELDPGDLEQYYLPLGSTTWSVLDLTTAAGGPQVAAGSSPSALYHDGYTSVYINAAGTHRLQNYFLTAIGNPWAVQDLTGILRQAYSPNLREAVQTELDKDFVRMPVHEIEKHLAK